VLNPTALYADFLYNALGQRTLKRTYLTSGALDFTITHLYGADGQLLGQVRYNNLGKKTSALYWIWLDGMPLAEVEFKYNTGTGAVTSTSQYYLHSDHLNTPRLATNQAQTLLWSWDSDAFGLGNPNGDPDGDGVVVDIPLRFPGQIFEAYSNLNYNYFRDYDPDKGRYVQSDPIGLEGGLNTYGYVLGNPISFADPSGLAPCPPGTVSPGTPCYMSDPSGKTGYPNEGRCATGDCAANIPRQNDLRGPDFVNFQVDMCLVSAWGTFSRDGNSYAGFGFNRTYPSALNLSGSVSLGWLNRGYVREGDVNNFLSGYAANGTKAYYYVGGGVAYSPGNGTATMIGVGAGASKGASSNNGGSAGAGNSYNQGETGVKW
ncbi:MAG: RHS repeat-associated core domain-containing protein, partial [Pseudomonas sp.]|uniref:RHS repeat-associated core domain-containing protein n=1 Tax=Pseudomonas sp. TaxID=306 RepID=UPI0030F206CB